MVLPSIQVDTELFRSRPGLTVRHLAWHPDSDTHLALLTSDNILRLYNVNTPFMAEQTFELGKQSRRAVVGVGVGRRDTARRRSHKGGHLSEYDDQPLFVSFAFHLSSSSSSAAVPSWERFCIYFISSHGHLYSLCPVVPFGCAFSSLSIHSLKESMTDDEDKDNSNSLAWLQRAFPSSSSLSSVAVAVAVAVAVPPISSSSPQSSTSIVTSVPHALDEHSPVLVGPIPFVTPGSDPFSTMTESSAAAGSVIDFTSHSTTTTSSSNSNNKAESMLWMSIGNGCSAILIGTTDGTIGAHILTGSAVPTWHECAPQCLLRSGRSAVPSDDDDDDVMAVRSQVSGRSGGGGGLYMSLQQLLLLDVIQLNCFERRSRKSCFAAQEDYDYDEGEGEGSDSFAYGTTPSSSCLYLRQDAEAEEVAYCIHATGGVYAITLPWLPLLSNALLTAAMHTSGSGLLPRSSSSSVVLPSVLPPATVTTLFSSTAVAAVPGGIVDCVAVGDKLAGSGLLLLLGDGSYRCLSRQGKQGEQQLSSTHTTAAAEHQEECEIQAQIKAIYEDLLHPPSKAPLPSTNNYGVATPEGQRLLSQCIKALQSTHAEYIHRVHHDLSERLPLIKQEAEKQKVQIDTIKQLAKKVTSGSQSLHKRASRAEEMQVNLTERLRLLAELYVAIPSPVSGAEKRFAEEELPQLEGAVRDLVGRDQNDSWKSCPYQGYWCYCYDYW